MIRRLFLCLLLFAVSNACFSQIDKEFWFAVPYVNPTNGNLPVFLRFQAFGQAAEVTIDIPANASFPKQSYTIAANSAYSINISTWLPLLECTPENTILATGLHIVSSREISVYYEVYGASAYAPGTNSDLFTLKGRNALGTTFFTPFQKRWNNQININAWASFDIIATQNNTTITITPSTPITGHVSAVPFTLVLNKGQTWSGRAFFTDADLRPTGTMIEADKPIAVTVKDDSMLKNNNWDLGGDQLIPVSQIGKQYIVLKHTLNTDTDNDFVYVLATEDQTEIYLGDHTVPDVILDKGKQIEIPVTESIVINASAPVYVLHVTGFANELAEAVLPQLQCTGSKEVGFIRSNQEAFVLNILTAKGNESNFILNGTNTLIKAVDFTEVTGMTGWVYASKEFSLQQIPALKANLLKNTSGYFHLSIMNGADNTGFRYGYFSDYGFVDLGRDTLICKGTPYELSAGIQKDSYAWAPTGETTATIVVRDSGTYSVVVMKSTCSFKDTIHISYFPPAGKIITDGKDSTCANIPLTIKTNSGFTNLNWSTGSATDSIIVTDSKKYYVSATDPNGCIAKDSVFITVLPVPAGNIIYSPADNETFCATGTVHLQAPPDYAGYLWFNGHTDQEIETPKVPDGIYEVTLTDSLGCKNTLNTEVDCSVFIKVYNLVTPNGDALNDFFEIENLQYNTYSLNVYNCWGALVYSNDHYNNDWNDKALEDGVYYYSLTHYKNKRNLKGWFHVLH